MVSVEPWSVFEGSFSCAGATAITFVGLQERIVDSDLAIVSGNTVNPDGRKATMRGTMSMTVRTSAQE